ncbi:hypothetical protein [Paenibacillus sp. 481]|uniref:hypothetical protein n=1 Tax=Paenibacillus sp. 481 TaxID=2835869 RepID=UPI001E536703|nr:hypothetical protein [Paenibacillus sp. 481]UHA74571.1 hypothetical protein KIK04_05620 [Paenibacillus sp. 481]
MIVHLCRNDWAEWRASSLFVHLKRIVDEWDPLGLLALGAPKDEYDCLSLYVTRLFAARPDVMSMVQQLEENIEEHFGIGPSVMNGERRELWRKKMVSFCERVLSDRMLFECLEQDLESLPELKQLSQSSMCSCCMCKGS